MFGPIVIQSPLFLNHYVHVRMQESVRKSKSKLNNKQIYFKDSVVIALNTRLMVLNCIKLKIYSCMHTQLYNYNNKLYFLFCDNIYFNNHCIQQCQCNVFMREQAICETYYNNYLQIIAIIH